MPVNSSAAAGAYSAIANLTNSIRGDSAKAGMEGKDSGFGEIVDTMLANVAKTGNVAEAQGQKIVEGNADVLDLVTAVAETELAVETLVTVRDRVISAYQDILNMPI